MKVVFTQVEQLVQRCTTEDETDKQLMETMPEYNL